jgi:hypothetical protein
MSMANSKHSITQDSETQEAEQAAPSDASRFESWRAHHPHKIHIVMPLRPRDRNPLVCGIGANLAVAMDAMHILAQGEQSFWFNVNTDSGRM